jgi:hypothetical protein
MHSTWPNQFNFFLNKPNYFILFYFNLI